ncbi:YraN family protein [Candidatus Gracilibacteria bacterium]|nr:YraN family protein [Candidatus Gracilibacteria bacterium]NJM87840.1 YraN family protein [Hydrococcus sp. RU_2_2]NJP20218.1 YraN family protein [Hydrococcus sp. CRU_1_1]NJQ96892.1 YraN family protein [Hydrococcus sp. CSU_1_8]
MTRDRKSKDKIGRLGEQIVSQWLEMQDWETLHRRWHCRWGEIDVIACSQSSQTIAFVEIKTRGKGNWDGDGILSITSPKQTKLCSTAALFLSENPEFAEFACRFDVALVSHQPTPTDSDTKSMLDESKQSIIFNRPIILSGYQLTLHNYIESAFDC